MIASIISAAGTVLLLAEPSAAAASTSLVFSVDGGTTWSAMVNAAPGQVVWARMFYDNNTAATLTGTALNTSVPNGFTLIPGSTEACLVPGASSPSSTITERVCSTDPGQSGAIDESTVWQGPALTISPTAGLLGQPTGQTVGPLAAGKKRYLRVVNCDYRQGTDHFTASISNAFLSSLFRAGTTASNTAATTPACGPGGPARRRVAANSGVQNIALTGQRFLVLQNCDYVTGSDHYTDSIATTPAAAWFGAGTTASNSSPAGPACGPGHGASVFDPSRSGSQTMGLLTNRYVHIANCVYSAGGDLYTSSIATTPVASAFGAGTGTSNIAPTALTCASNGSSAIAPLVTGVQDIDLLDTHRGQGYVQFRMRAPRPTTTVTYHQTAQLTAPGVPPVTSAGVIIIDPTLGTPVVDPAVGLGTVSLLTAAGGGAWFLRRRRTQA